MKWASSRPATMGATAAAREVRARCRLTPVTLAEAGTSLSRKLKLAAK